MKTLLFTGMVAFPLLLLGCEEKSPIEEAADDVGDAVEDAADEVGDAAREVD
mgnify:CR=1 FL=1